MSRPLVVLASRHLIAVVGTFLLGCAVLLLMVGCAGTTSSEAPREKEQGHTEATNKEQGHSPKATASEEARCGGTRTVKAKYGGTSVTNDLPGCSNGGPLLGTDKIDSLDGKDGDDEIRGLEGQDLLFGGPGNDVIYGGPGGDYVSCGHGHDEVFADRADVYGGDCERVHLTSKEQGHAEATKKDHPRSPEATASEEVARRQGTRTFKKPTIGQGILTTNDLPGCPKGGLLEGTDKPDKLAGEEGADVVRGLGANDFLTGGHGSHAIDFIYGGPGNDLLIENEVRGPGCADYCPGVESSDLPRRSGPDHSKNVLHGGPGRDGLKGAAGDDVLYGGDGDDNGYVGQLAGLGGEDVLYGGDGDDTLYGTFDGGDRDKLYCGRGKDEYEADKNDYVDSSCEKKMGPGGRVDGTS